MSSKLLKILQRGARQAIHEEIRLQTGISVEELNNSTSAPNLPKAVLPPLIEDTIQGQIDALQKRIEAIEQIIDEAQNEEYQATNCRCKGNNDTRESSRTINENVTRTDG